MSAPPGDAARAGALDPAGDGGREARLPARILAYWGPPALVFVAFLAVWYATSYLLLDADRRFLLPPPHRVITEGFLDPATRAELLGALASTSQVMLLGLSLAILSGVIAAVVMSQRYWIERSFYPYAILSQTIPILAMVPLIGFWLGFNFTSRVIIVVIVSVFPIVTNTLLGLKSAEPELHDLFTLHRASRRARLVKLQLPGAIPAMIASFRISAGLAVIGAIIADFFFRQGQPGLGRLLDVYRARLQTEALFSAVILCSLLGIAVFAFFGWLGQRLTRSWHASARP